MSAPWQLKWEGRAVDFIPDNLAAVGAPGRLATSAQDAIWEALQGIGGHDPEVHARVLAMGTEDPTQPGIGSFVINFYIGNLTPKPEDSPGSVLAPTDPEPAGTITARHGD